MVSKKKLFAGVGAILGFLFAVSEYGGYVALTNSGNINAVLGCETSKIVKGDNSDNIDTQYFKSTIGSGKYTKADADILWQKAYEQNINEMKEGAALLKNDNNCLPLKSGAHISLFGHATVQPLYDCMAAGTRTAYAPTHRTDYVTAFKNAGFSVNDALVNALKGGKAVRGKGSGYMYTMLGIATATGSATGSEENKAFYEAQRSTYSADYKDAAIVLIAREGAEGTDIKMDDDDDIGGKTEKISGLALHKNERDMLQIVRQDFSKVIVLLNSPYQLEVEEIKEYADAIMYVGSFGHKGTEGVASIIKGETNPSGRLTDTYAVNSLSAPACVNSGTRSPEFGNLSYILEKLGDTESSSGYTANENITTASVQVENIYIGYRYYETRYADCVYGTGKANCSAGSIDGKAWNYSKEVSYPFGTGLSYTTFKQEIASFKEGSDTVDVKVKVTNTGNVKGKHSVLLYAQTPYGDYEKKNEIEKSAIQFVGYNKTKLLAPGESETVDISVDKYLLASYDQINAKGYVLSAGTYTFAVGDNIHDALNNILASQNYTKANGMDAEGNKNLTKSYKGSLDTTKFQKGENEVVVTNQFEDRDLNYWKENSATYLSRSDWDKTYPKKQTIVNATDKMIEVLSGRWYRTNDKTSPYYSWSDEARKSTVTYQEIASKFRNLGADLEITIPTMRDVPVDDPLWDTFIFQGKIEDLCPGTGENLASAAVGYLAPSFNNGDGCDSTMLSSGGIFYYDDSGNRKSGGMSLRYCSNTIYTGTFNPEIHENRGYLMGEELLFSKAMMYSGTGNDLHRTPFGGRNFEYMSECPTVNYLVSIPQVRAVEKSGAHAAPKHFCNNDQESDREGHTTFFREQAFREGSLRAFEGSLRVAKAGGLMASFERNGLIWNSADYKLNSHVLRGEWGFKGFIVTDASKNDEANINKDKGYFNHAREGFVAGTTNWCFDTDGVHAKYALARAKEENDGYMLLKIIEATKYWLHGIATSPVINGISSTDKIVPVTPAWITAIHTIRIVTGVGFGLCTGAAIVFSISDFLKKRRL